jgi:hypothetical protein
MSFLLSKKRALVPLQWKAYMGGKVFVSFFLLGVDNGV